MTTPYLPAATLPDEDWWQDDAALRRLVSHALPPDEWKAVEPRLAALGKVAPREVDPLAREADARGPQLAPDGSVQLGQAYRRLQALAREHRVFTLAWHPLGAAERASRVATFALGYLFAQAEAGYYCPACMTDGAALVLERHARPELASRFVPRLVQDSPEGAFEGAMFLTEKSGGSDVGATASTVKAAGDGTWRVTGDKWFSSNANAEVILALARVPGAAPGTKGLGLFLLPSMLPDGTPNPGIHRLRLKEKLGVRSMATAEIELRDAHAEMVAPPPDGFRAMLEMVNLSRLYNAVTSVAIARRALREGQKNGAWREAFGKRLKDQPLYARAVAELAVDVRGALFFVLDTAATFDKAFRDDDDDAYRLLRALTPLAKAATAKLAVRAASEACEFLGGNGYVEEWVTPRLLRDAQVLPIWEGTSNVQALDFARACAKDGAAAALVDDSLSRVSAHGGGSLAAAWRQWAADLAHPRTAVAREMASWRQLMRAYHLRAATLLVEDALRDDDPAAHAFAKAYVALRVEEDAAAFERLVEEQGARLAGWPTG